MTCPRLIEVALPIREISAESVRQKKAQRGHISTLHLWWARRPLAASRAVVFASLVPDPDDPECPPEFREAVQRLLKEEVALVLKLSGAGRKVKEDPDPYLPYEGIADTPRNRLLAFIAKWSREWIAFEKGERGTQPKPDAMLDDRSLVKWETGDPDSERARAVLAVARELVSVANGRNPPVTLDPFAGGGAIPLEAARLGCQAIASDYNSVAYLILRATCEFPQKYGKPGVRKVEGELQEREVPNVLTYDVGYWAKRILDDTYKRIGHLYPTSTDGNPLIGYLWARTAPCSNPSCRAEIPLIRSLILCNKPDKRVALTLNVTAKETSFGVIEGKDVELTEGTMIEKAGGDVRCPVCKQTTSVEDLRRAGLHGQMGERMICAIANSPQGKKYRAIEGADRAAFEEAECLVESVERPNEYIVPEINGPHAHPDAGAHRSISVDIYGFKTFGSLFNKRQLLAMQTLVACLCDTLALLEKQESDREYRIAIATYLGLWLSRASARYCSLTIWNKGEEKFEHPFGRQAIPMTWDYPEPNPFSLGSAGLHDAWDLMRRVIVRESCSANPALVLNSDASGLQLATASVNVVVTDPPYFDAIAYADLSDFFYIWLKRGLEKVLPDAFTTPQTQKSEEAVAHKHRHRGNRKRGKEHFQRKLTQCFGEAKRVCKPDGVMTVMFAHQSTEAWTALINALFDSGLTVTATYPIDTELTTALKGLKASLASSITVACRPREAGGAATLKAVRRGIEEVVRESLRRFWGYGLRGADLIVACYGPAVGVFGRYERVERADGTPVDVPELLEFAKQAALKAIAGEFTGDALSRLYFVWANLYGTTEQAWDDARIVVMIGGDSEDAMEVARRRGVFVVEGAKCRLALLRDRADRRHLGDDAAAPLIDQLHHAMQLWKEERRSHLVDYLREHDLVEHAGFWKLGQALFEVLPRTEEDWKIVNALLSERDTLRKEAKRTAAAERAVADGMLFDR